MEPPGTQSNGSQLWATSYCPLFSTVPFSFVSIMHTLGSGRRLAIAKQRIGCIAT